MDAEKEDDMYIIITVKNLQDKIEGIIRSIVWKNLNNSQGGRVPKILVVDLGSDDETPKILEKLCNEYDFIIATDKNEYAKFVEEMIK
jgi:glycosyltransferase involved in cell wall biosynthesis